MGLVAFIAWVAGGAYDAIHVCFYFSGRILPRDSEAFFGSLGEIVAPRLHRTVLIPRLPHLSRLRILHHIITRIFPTLISIILRQVALLVFDILGLCATEVWILELHMVLCRCRTVYLIRGVLREGWNGWRLGLVTW